MRNVLSPLLLLASPLLSSEGSAQTPPAKTEVVSYPLPELLRLEDGTPVKDAAGWQQRRTELLRFFRDEIYGTVPENAVKPRFGTVEKVAGVRDGLAERRQVTVFFTDDDSGPRMHLLIYLPSERKGRVPVFLGMNFRGNQALEKDPGIRLTHAWTRNRAPEPGQPETVVNNRFTEASRGSQPGPWPVEQIIRRGYALVTFHYCDVAPDDAGEYRKGYEALFGRKPNIDNSGAISVWAWGASRALDWIETQPDLDAQHVAVLGHSRLGKTALWAAAQDERFWMAIAAQSGQQGAALGTRMAGESINAIRGSFPHWFCAQFKKYSDTPPNLPRMDQHGLIALIAPRPVYISSAQDDNWADPEGEFLGARSASPAWTLLGAEGLPASQWPEVGTASMGGLGYHVRKGGHSVTVEDWRWYLDFADRHLKKTAPEGR